jgi:hypothetical protein
VVLGISGRSWNISPANTGGLLYTSIVKPAIVYLDAIRTCSSLINLIIFAETYVGVVNTSHTC